MIIPPSEYAGNRSWSIGQFPLSAAPHLEHSWAYSRNQLQAIQHRLNEADLPAGILTVGVAGSLARMEATKQSDCDLVVVLDRATTPRSEQGRKCFDAVWRALAPLGLGNPEATGIYSGPVHVRDVLDPETIGQVAEDQQVFGSRFLFLLELQPVWGAAAFSELAQQIVARYAARYVALDPAKQWTYLLNDLVRYYKSLCQTYLFAELPDDYRWRLRNLKARHSRLLMYAGLLFLLGDASRITTDKEAWLTTRLTWTPLERLAACYASRHDQEFTVLANCLNRFVSAMADPLFRSALAETTEPGSPLARESNPQFVELKRNGDAFMGELLRFALARRGEWADRFFEFWLF